MGSTSLTIPHVPLTKHNGRRRAAPLKHNRFYDSSFTTPLSSQPVKWKINILLLDCFFVFLKHLVFKLGRYQNILNGTQPSTTPTALQPYRRMLMALGWAWHVQAAHQSSGMIAFGSRSTSRVCGCRTAVMSNLFHAAVFLFFFFSFISLWQQELHVLAWWESWLRGSGEFIKRPTKHWL